MVQGAAQAIGSHHILTVVLDRAAEKIGLPESYSYDGDQQPPRTVPREREWFSWRRHRTAEGVDIVGFVDPDPPRIGPPGDQPGRGRHHRRFPSVPMVVRWAHAE
jgi:hypothetical protein